ncbi:TIGR00730 family Rossman fold protein [Ferruginibacter sp.]|uniref:LOG family protein n=1 Tax=Ferruginibacter sp. TaxID=1940288 RepID=UPI00265A887B|nr:TIGR00730 family Rossman fold protein [Ferruginibacter sp.]
MQYKSIAVFCGSKTGNNILFATHATQLGYLLAEKNITLIYGGGNKGLMASVANAVLEKGGKVIGIIPQILTQWEHHHQGITELIVVETMHVRKRMLYEKCDAAIVLPGGYGTLDELFEMLTWNQLRIHDKPIYILNSDGFYDGLIIHINNMQQENFLYHEPANSFTVVNTPEEIFIADQ